MNIPTIVRVFKGVVAMAEFCLECFNKINKTNYSKYDCVLSKDLCFCEECNELKKAVISIRKSFWDELMEYFTN